MPMGDFFGALRRRWVMVLVGVLMTVGLSGGAYVFFKPTYEITATVLLLPPAPIDQSVTPNPYLRLGGLQQAVDLIAVSLMDQTTQLELQGISKDVSYNVVGDPRTSSPLLLIDVKDSSPETALKIRDLLVNRVPVLLKDLQTSLGVETKDLVTSTVITLDKQAEEVGRNKLRAAVVAAAGGLALTLAVAALWDAHRSRRPGRRAAQEEIPAEESDDQELLDDEGFDGYGGEGPDDDSGVSDDSELDDDLEPPTALEEPDAAPLSPSEELERLDEEEHADASSDRHR